MSLFTEIFLCGAAALIVGLVALIHCNVARFLNKFVAMQMVLWPHMFSRKELEEVAIAGAQITNRS